MEVDLTPEQRKFRDELPDFRRPDGRPASRVDVVSLDQEGIVFGLANFFAGRDIEIADVATRRYSAAHTGAPMFSVQMTVSIPARVNLGQIRDEFADLCDRMNLDAILDPVKS